MVQAQWPEQQDATEETIPEAVLREAEETIEAAWERAQGGAPVSGDRTLEDAVFWTLRHLDGGDLRVATRSAAGDWATHEWIKKAILLWFRISQSSLVGPMPCDGFDKIPSKFEAWTESRFTRARIRVVPPSAVRYSAYLGEDVVVMPAFINVGAHVGAGTMVDSWATVGSCAQIGKRCHISAGACIAGVLEPPQARPVIVEDDCFIGAASVIAEGVIVEERAVVSAGVVIDASTPVVDSTTGVIYRGRVPAGAVVKSGVIPLGDKHLGAPLARCAVISKQADERTRAKTSINALLRPP